MSAAGATDELAFSLEGERVFMTTPEKDERLLDLARQMVAAHLAPPQD